MLIACMERTLKSTAPWDRNTHIIPLSISVKCLCIAVLFNGHDYQNLSKDKQRDVLAEVITQGVENRNPPSSIKMLNCCDNSELETEEGNMDIEIYFWYLTSHSRGLKYSHLCIFAGVLWQCLFQDHADVFVCLSFSQFHFESHHSYEIWWAWYKP